MTALATTAPPRPSTRASGRGGGRPLYRPVSGLVLRAPLLPASDHQDRACGPDAGAVRAWGDPAVRFAVQVASPDLTEALDAATGGAARPVPSRAGSALQRYLIRASTRPTPFGGFAAAAVTTWADATDLRIPLADRPTRTRPDMAWLTAIARAVAEDPEHGRHLRTFSNRCAFERDGRIYLADRSTSGISAGPDVSLRATPAVRRVLQLARGGAALNELRDDLAVRWPAAGAAAVDALLADLCAQQLLLPELLPGLTADPLRHVADRVRAVPSAHHVSAALEEIRAACARVDAVPPAQAGGALTIARERVRALARRVAAEGVDTGDPVQVDSALPLVGAGLARRVGDEIARAVDVLLRLHPAPEADRIAGFRTAFHRRYGDDRPVPLLEVLDPRFGIGSIFDAGGVTPGGHDAAVGVRARRDAALRRLVTESIRAGGTEVELCPELLDELALWTPVPSRLAPSLEVSVFLAASGPAAIDRGDYQLVVGPNLGAAAAGRGLGRFADLLGVEATALLHEIADAEASRGAATLTAELVYRPLRGRSANVAVRAHVRDHEIPVGVAPSGSGARVIGMDELWVMHRHGRFRVIVDRDGLRELSVSEGHMLNQSAAPAVCRMLTELAGDGTVSLAPFDWGSMTAMPYLPRVCTGRVVLHPAQWRLAMPASASGAAGFEARLGSWRSSWAVPRHVYLTAADNRLLFDLEDGGHREQLRSALARSGTAGVVLQEGLSGPGDAWLPGPRGRHLVELVVPMVREVGTDRPGQGRSGRPGATTVRPVDGRGGARSPRVPVRWTDEERFRPPGSDWLYLALRGPRVAEDGVLTGALGASADRLVDEGVADGWFFVRYADPEPELRLRLHGHAEALYGRVLPELTAEAVRAIARGDRTAMTLQTYERELERYGGPVTTAICERIACADSAAVRRILASNPTLRGPSAARGAEQRFDRIELGVVCVAGLLSALATDPDELLRWCAGTPTPESGQAYRERKDRLRELLARGPDPATPLGAALDRRAAEVASLGGQLRDRYRDGSGTHPIDELVPSLVHLHVNRLGLDHPTEALVLGLLDRTLCSLRAHALPPA
jgi:thiopeptide-type bacteriocin biosynthesis protein